MSKIERTCCLVSHIGGYLMIVDQILDGLAVKEYYGKCATGSVDCLYWKLAILFLFLPTLVCTIWVVYRYHGSKKDYWNILIYGIFYPITMPISIIIQTYRIQSWRQEKDLLAFNKFFEVGCEALPQLLMSWHFYDKYKWEFYSGTLLLSKIFSSGMLVYGMIRGVIACRYGCNEQLPVYV